MKVRLSMLLVVLLAFVSCWTTGSVEEPTQFEGRWLNLSAINNFKYADYSYTFTGNTFVFREEINQSIILNQTITGTFKFTEKKIQFTSGKRKWIQMYTLIGNEFSLGKAYNGPNYIVAAGYGAFTKQ